MTSRAHHEVEVPWIGSLPEDWALRRLRTVAHVATGGRDTVDRVDDGRYPFFVRSQKVERINTFSFEGEAVLTAGDGAGVGKVFHYVNEKFDFHQRVYKFSNFRDVDGRFFFQYLRAMLSRETSAGTAKSTVDSLRRPMLLNFPVAVPSMEEQELIVRFLDNAEVVLGRAIAAKRELVELLDEALDAVQWAALTNDAAPRHRNAPAWMGSVSEAWTPTRLKALLREVDRRSTTGTEPLLSLRMREGLVPSAEYSNKPQDPSALAGYKIVDPGMLVMNRMRASIGLFGVATERGLVSPDYATFIVRPGADVHLPFLLGLLKSRRMGALIRSESRGMGTGASGFLRIYSDRFGALPIALPDRSEQESRAAIALQRTNELAAASSATLHEIELLREYRKRLIEDVVTGRRDVRSDAAALPDVDQAELAAVSETSTGNVVEDDGEE